MVDHSYYPKKHTVMYENYKKNTNIDGSIYISKQHHLGKWKKIFSFFFSISHMSVTDTVSIQTIEI